MSDHADIVREALICPEHKMRDCSPLLNGCSKVNALHAALDALVAERDEARRELDETVEAYHARLREKSAAEAERDRLADNNKHTHANLDFCIEQRTAAEARVTELEAALGAVKAWLNQEEEVGLGVPDILWDIILAAAPTKEGT